MIAPMSTRRSSVGVGVVKGLLYAVRFSFLHAYKSMKSHTFQLNNINVLRLVDTMELHGNVYPA